MAQIIKNENEKVNTLVDTADSSNIYIGNAKIGADVDTAVWQILKVEKSGSVYSFLYADGNLRFDNVWSNRSGLNYS